MAKAQKRGSWASLADTVKYLTEQWRPAVLVAEAVVFSTSNHLVVEASCEV